MAVTDIPKRGVPDDFYYACWQREDARRAYVNYRIKIAHESDEESERLAAIFRLKMYELNIATIRYEQLVSDRRIKNWKRMVYRDWERYDLIHSSPFRKVRITNGR